MSLEYVSQIYMFSYIFLLSEMGCQNVSDSQNKKTGCCCGLMSKSRGMTDTDPAWNLTNQGAPA